MSKRKVYWLQKIPGKNDYYKHWDAFFVEDLVEFCKKTFRDWEKAYEAIRHGGTYGCYAAYNVCPDNLLLFEKATEGLEPVDKEFYI